MRMVLLQKIVLEGKNRAFENKILEVDIEGKSWFANFIIMYDELRCWSYFWHFVIVSC